MRAPGSGGCQQPPPITQRETLLSKAHPPCPAGCLSPPSGPLGALLPPQLGSGGLDDTHECRGG